MKHQFLPASLNVSNHVKRAIKHFSIFHSFAFYFPISSPLFLLLLFLGSLAQLFPEESSSLKAPFNPRDLVDEINAGVQLTSISREVVRCPPGRETNDLHLGVGEDVVELPKLYRRESSHRRRFIFAFVFVFTFVFTFAFSEGPRVEWAPPYFTGIGRTNSSSRV